MLQTRCQTSLNQEDKDRYLRGEVEALWPIPENHKGDVDTVLIEENVEKPTAHHAPVDATPHDTLQPKSTQQCSVEIIVLNPWDQQRMSEFYWKRHKQGDDM